jgi:1,2-diacylglycerol 3-beta-galactosyltransferase
MPSRSTLQLARERVARRVGPGIRRLRGSGDPLGGTDDSSTYGPTEPSILILFSDTGGGHRAAAKALIGAFSEIASGVRVEMFDPLVGHGTPVVRRLTSLYPTIIQRARPAWGAIYYSTNNRPAFNALRLGFGGGVRRLVEQRIRALDPLVVISVHPLLNHLTAGAIHRSSRHRPLITVVTDLIDLHFGWASPEADLVVVPTEEAGGVVIRRGVSPRRVRLLGFPVDLRFRPPGPGEREAVRARLGLDQGRPTLLVMSGGDGSGGLLHQVRALAWGAPEWQMIVVCGRNERLRSRLARVHFRSPTRVLGFVDDMPELMRACDLVVGKAGPGAIAESLATGLPLLITSYLPGQETANVRFVTDSGFGAYTPKPDDLRRTVEDLLRGDQERLETMAERAAAIAHPTASLDIARACLELSPLHIPILEGS